MLFNVLSFSIKNYEIKSIKNKKKPIKCLKKIIHAILLYKIKC